jgi:hypothetical protein
MQLMAMVGSLMAGEIAFNAISYEKVPRKMASVHCYAVPGKADYDARGELHRCQRECHQQDGEHDGNHCRCPLE